MSIDKLKSHYDWLKRMVAEATYMDDKIPLMAELDVADMELRVAITEGIPIDTLIALVEKCQMPPMSQATIAEYHVCGGGSHEYTEDELHEDCTVQILRCKQCGALSGAWWHGKAEAMRPTKHNLGIGQ